MWCCYLWEYTYLYGCITCLHVSFESWKGTWTNSYMSYCLSPVLWDLRFTAVSQRIKTQRSASEPSYVLSGWCTNCSLPLDPRGPTRNPRWRRVIQLSSQRWSNCCWRCCASCWHLSLTCIWTGCTAQHQQQNSRIEWYCHCWGRRRPRTQRQAKLWRKREFASFTCKKEFGGMSVLGHYVYNSRRNIINP